MAIDSAEQRRCISGIIPIFAPGIEPQYGVGPEWRQASGWGYMGIPVEKFGVYSPMFRRRRR